MHAATFQAAMLLFAQIGSNPFEKPRELPAEAADAKPIEFAAPANSNTPPTSDRTATTPNSADFTPRFVAPPTPIESFEFAPVETTFSDETRPTKSILRSNTVAPIEPSKVIQASAIQTDASFADVANPTLSRQILGRAAVLAQTNLPGDRITILDAIQSTPSRAGQLLTIKAYWRLSLILADYGHAEFEVELISNIAKPQIELEKRLWQSAVANAIARRQEAKLAAVAAQHDLVGLAESSTTDSLPLPADSPFVGPYKTKFEILFKDGAAPRELSKLNDTLPHSRDLVYARATAVDTSEQSLNAAINAYETGQISVSFVIDQFEKLRDQRIAFLASIRDYNNSIAEYALNVAGSSVSREDVVSMLIVTSPTNSSVSKSGPAARTARNERSLIRTMPPPSLNPIRVDNQPADVVPVKPSPGLPSSIRPTPAPIVTPADQFVPRKPAAQPSVQPPVSFDFDRR